MTLLGRVHCVWVMLPLILLLGLQHDLYSATRGAAGPMTQPMPPMSDYDRLRQGVEVRNFPMKSVWDSPNKQDDTSQATDLEPVDGGVEAEYRLHIGDRLLISVFGEENTEREVIVDSGGEITYPIVGTLDVLDKTIDEVREILNKKIGEFFRYTFVSITPVEFGGQSYTILGQVLSPGTKIIYGKETVLSAIARAGGFPVGQFRANDIDLADLKHAFLMQNGEYVPVDFERLVYEGDLSQDVQLHGGDYIFIPSVLDQEIFVLGEVFLPGIFNYLNSVTLMEAIVQAGGLGPNASSRVMVVRGSLCEPYIFHIDIMRIFKGCACDFHLQPGDIVYAPPRKFTYLRTLVQMAISTFVGSFASNAATAAFESVFGTTSNLQNVNVVSSGGFGTQVVAFPAPAPVVTPAP